MCSSLTAQSFSEWFRQKKTQRKYLGEQIIKLQAHLGLVKDGYKISTGGLGTIGNFKGGEFKLHDDYFNSLTHVSRAVTGYDKVSLAKAHIGNIKKTCPQMADYVAHSPVAAAAFKAQSRTFLNALIQEASRQERSLDDIITSGKVAMTEDQRIERINSIYSATVELRDLTGRWFAQVRALLMQQQRALLNNQYLRQLYR